MGKTNDLDFMWCCGIEDTFIADPHPETGKTLDEYELTGHYAQWRSDFDRVQSLGVDAVRWGIPWYKIQPDPLHWDWSWTDEAIPYLVEEKKVKLILDLMHYGTPLWMPKAFIDPDYPCRVEEYTAQVIDRYGKWVHMATPFNEPYTACEFAGNKAWWPPYLQGYDGFFSVFKGIMKGAQRQTRLLQQKGITSVHVECSGGSLAREPKFRWQASIETMVQSMYFDFLTGKLEVLSPFFPFFKEHGVSSADLDFFMANGTSIDVMGINYYPQFSFQELYTDANGNPARKNCAQWVEDLREILHQRYERYHCPMLVTETSIRDDMELKKRWLSEASSMVMQEQAKGLPIVGFTWFPIIDMYDWEYRINSGEKENFKACFGFWDSDRKANDCVGQYQQIIKNNKRTAHA